MLSQKLFDVDGGTFTGENRYHGKNPLLSLLALLLSVPRLSRQVQAII
jgi:hypothetical protein